mmetsp:Transcript_58488/g.163941  ORF Transcript_58488/g.163941 Transcript_58488/m.163941 type:complete len:297 (+) Transcript_58488:576-1466(+)
MRPALGHRDYLDEWVRGASQRPIASRHILGPDDVKPPRALQPGALRELSPCQGVRELDGPAQGDYLLGRLLDWDGDLALDVIPRHGVEVVEGERDLAPTVRVAELVLVAPRRLPRQAVEASHVVPPELRPVALILVGEVYVLREGVELRPAPVEYVHVGGLSRPLRAFGGALGQEAALEAERHRASDPLLWNRALPAGDGELEEPAYYLVVNELGDLDGRQHIGEVALARVRRLLVDIEEVRHNLRGREALQHDAGGLLDGLLLRLGLAADIEQRVHGAESRRPVVEALEAEALCG